MSLSATEQMRVEYQVAYLIEAGVTPMQAVARVVGDLSGGNVILQVSLERMNRGYEAFLLTRLGLSGQGGANPAVDIPGDYWADPSTGFNVVVRPVLNASGDLDPAAAAGLTQQFRGPLWGNQSGLTDIPSFRATFNNNNLTDFRLGVHGYLFDLRNAEARRALLTRL